MAIKTYLYRASGIGTADLQPYMPSASAVSVLVTTDTSLTPVSVDETEKDDLDAAMAQFGYDFVSEYTDVAPLVGRRDYGVLAVDPTSPAPVEGDFYYNTTSKTEKVYNGTMFVDVGAMGSVTSVFGRTGIVVAVDGDYDASEVSFTPSVLTDWDGDADPGDIDAALDQLAERVDDSEADIVTLQGDTHTHANKVQLDLVTDGDHDVRTDNPHGTDVGNLGSGTLAELNSAITDATLVDSSVITEIDGNVNDLITLSGVAENSTDLGTFTGTTITNASTVKTALQELEVAIEAGSDDQTAAEVPFTPAVLTDWDGDADPGSTKDALDQLAERVDDNESASHVAMSLGGVASDTTDDTLDLTGQVLTVNLATITTDGAMSAGDKSKLDGIAASANNYSHPNHTGDVTSIADGAQTIAANAVSNTKAADMPALTLKGNDTGSVADPKDLTVVEVQSLLNVADGATEGILADDEGTPVTGGPFTKVNAVGAGITATGAAGVLTLTVAGGGAPVDSVFGRTGTVVAVSGDYDATEVTYTPAVLTDWDGDADPGDVDDALDQLAERVDDNEADIVTLQGDTHTHANKAQLDLVSDGDHDVRTDNPHGTDIGNLGSGTLAELNTAVTDATLVDSSVITEIDGNVDDLITLSGVAENSTDLGTFTGTTITDSQTIKAALQELETAVEAGSDDQIADEVPFTPSVLTDWDGDADPGSTKDALDQLAERVDDNEGSITSLVGDQHVAVTLGGVASDTTDDTLDLTGQVLTVNLATITTDGAMSAGDKSKLDGIATGANNYSHPNHTGDVTSVADGAQTIAANAVTNAKAADMAAYTLKVRNNVASGDPQDVKITGTTVEAAPAAGDFILLELADGSLAHADIDDLPGGVDTDAIHDNVAAEISAITAKATPINADYLLIEDSEAGDAKKRITLGDLPAPSGIIRSLFYPANSASPGTRGQHVAIAVGSNGAINLEFAVPSDFGSLTTVAACFIPDGTNASANIDIYSTYGGPGEVFNTHAESDTTITYSWTADEISLLDISSIFSSLAANDACGVQMDHNATGAGDYIGIVLEYMTA
jgi:hypothetical protein